jgi:AcrR family transcriptional regulator
MDVKPPRRYESPRRREQADETRARILAAARELFEAKGYTATSMNAIAAAAGVALKTVYVAFGSKAGLLRALWHLLLRGDEGEAPVAERDWYREALDEQDPMRQLELNARNSYLVKQRVAGIMEVIETAAHADAEIASLWQRIQTEFRSNQGAIVRSLQRKKALKHGLGAERATDLLWALNHVSLYRLLVRDRGWTGAQYERWLAAVFCSELLRPSLTSRRDGRA